MDKTLTIRLDKVQDEALTARAEALGQSKSEIVRHLLAKGLSEEPLGRRIGHVRGRLELPAPKSAWQRKLKDRNWR